MFECSVCSDGSRAGRGCQGGSLTHEGRPAIFEGERYATDTCPRRPLLEDADLAELFDTFRDYEKRPNLRAKDELSQKAMTAIAVISDARAWKFERDMERAKAKGGGA